jgi:hypothetical protein
MDKFKFFVSLIGLFFLGVVLAQNDVPNYGFIIFSTACLVVSLRRLYLKLNPWMIASLKDIEKYFREG